MQTNSPPSARVAKQREPDAGLEHPHPPMMAELFRRAEARLRKRQKIQNPRNGQAVSPADARRQFHELQVHQVELEMQNVELQEARERTEALLEKYTDLYDFAPVGYFTLGLDGTIRQVNLAGARLAGIERARLLGQSFGLLVCESLRPVFKSFLKQVFAGHTKHSGEFVLSAKGQPARSVDIEARRSLDRLECRAVVVDITERRQAEDRLRVSEVRYRRLFEAANDGVVLLDPGTRKITDANPFMTKLLGYTHDQLVGKELFEIGLLKDQAASREMFSKLKQEHEVRYEDLPLRSQEGRLQDVEVVANLYQENGHSVIQCNIRDITQRRLAEIALNRLAAIVEFSDDAMIGKDPGGIITSWNKGAETTFGYTAREVVGTSIMRLIPAGRRDLEKKILEKVKSGEGVQHFETLRKTKDRRLINVSVTISPIKDATGRVIGISKVARDITARKRAEAAQRRMEVLAASNRKLEQEIVRRQAVEKSLKESEQHQRRLLAQSRQIEEQLRQLSRQVLRVQEEERRRISRELHDVIAQTLTGLTVRLANLRAEAAAGAGSLIRNIARTQKLVEHSVNVVHRFARELRPPVLDDLGLIPALHTFMMTLRRETGLRVSLSAFAAVEQLNGDKRTVLYRVAQEALTNVARHAHASRADVVIRKLDHDVCMRIRDDGKGLRGGHRLHPLKRKRLGLLGMKERLEMVGGSLNVASAPGKGTTVLARIPLDDVRAGGAENPRMPRANTNA